MKYCLTYLAVLGFMGQLMAQQTVLFPVTVKNEIEDPKALFEETKDKILTNYYSTELTEKDLYWAAIKGMLRHISPPENPELATIWTVKQYDKVANSLRGKDVSLGIETTLDAVSGALTITNIEENAPVNGILELYDRILRIDGKPLKGLTNRQVTALLNGPDGSEVVFLVNRDIDILELKVIRQSFKIANLVITEIPSRSTALIEIHKVYLGLAKELETALDTLQKKGYKNLILDLRHNTGGVLNEGVKVVNLFLQPRNIIMRTLSRSDQSRPIAADRKGFDFNVLILIDERTASASEIIVSALQDHKRATILGTKTYGKGVIETTYSLNPDYKVKFITSAMYSPKGVSWQGKGLLPDILIQQDDKSYALLADLPPLQRINKDIYLITAFKLLP